MVSTTSISFDKSTLDQQGFMRNGTLPLPLQKQDDLSYYDLDYLYIQWGLATIFTVIMTLSSKRKYLGLSCCWGRPGCYVALNMVDFYENRLGCILALGVTASMCYDLVLTFSTSSALTALVVSSLITTLGAPYLICQTMNNKLAGGLVGFCFCFTMLVGQLLSSLKLVRSLFKISMVFGCWFIAFHFPQYVCLALLKMKFVKMIVMAVKCGIINKRNGKVGYGWMFGEEKNWLEDYNCKYVNCMFKRKAKNNSSSGLSRLEKVMCKLKSSIYETKTEFKYSFRILSIVFLSFLFVYMLVMQIALFIYALDLKTQDSSSKSQNYSSISQHLLLVSLDLSVPQEYYISGKISLWLALALSVICFFFVMLNSLKWYRFHVLNLRKGNWSSLPYFLQERKFDSISPSELMVFSLRFAGYQIACALWGFFFFFLLLAVFLFIVSVQIILPLKNNELSFLIRKIVAWGPSFAIGLVFSGCQYLLARFVFVIDANTLRIDNRRLFHETAFLFYYTNIFVGLLLSFFRVLYGLLFVIIFFPRLQKSILPKSYEKWDTGYMSYTGFILLEHYHANPVMQCFVRILLEVNGKPFLKDNSDYSSTPSTVKEPMPEWLILKTRAINRWHLFVFLLKNPSQQQYRSHRLKPRDSSNQTFTSNFTFNNQYTSEGDDYESFVVMGSQSLSRLALV